MTRPGRLLSTMTRSPSRAASRTLWVTNSTVSVRSAQIRSSSSCSRSRVIASSAPNGSSISSTSASWASARARATRCRMPPDSSCGRLSPKPPSRTAPAARRSRRRRSARGTPLARSASSTLRPRRQPREQRGLLEHQRRPGRPTVSTWPDGGRVQPGHQGQQRALAAAGRADQADELAVGHGQRHLVQGEHARAARSRRPCETPVSRTAGCARPRSARCARRQRLQPPGRSPGALPAGC